MTTKPTSASSKALRCERGATLLESLFALVIVAIGSVATAQVQGHFSLHADIAASAPKPCASPSETSKRCARSR